MLRPNYFNFILCVIIELPFFILTFIINELCINLFIFFLIIFPIVTLFLDTKENHPVITYKDSKWWELYLAYIIDYAILGCIIFLIVNLTGIRFLKITPENPLFFISLWTLTRQVFYRSIGFRIMRLKINVNSIGQKIKLIFLNFIVFAFWYCSILNILFPSIAEIATKCGTSLLLLSTINNLSRVFIIKKASFLENVFNIKIIKLEKGTEKKAENEF